MTRREQLQEQYEDALFALMMDEVATVQGQRLLEENERLKNDPEAAVPEEVSKHCLQTIRKRFAKRSVHAAGRFTIKVFGKVAMVAGIAALLFTVTFATSETVRVNTLNLVVEVFRDRTSFSFAGDQSPKVPEVTIGWLPNGYELKDQGKDDFEMWYIFSKSETETIQISYLLSNGTVLSVDTENARTENIEIDGMPAKLIQKGDQHHIIYATEDKTAFVSLIATGITSDDLIRVANSLEYKN